MKKRIALLIALVLMIAALVPSALAEGVSPEEEQAIYGQMEMALENTKALRKQLLAPATMVLNGDVLVVTCGEDTLSGAIQGAYTLTLIHYTSSNEYGVPIQNLAVFDGAEYIGTRAEIEEMDTQADQISALAKAMKPDSLEDMMTQLNLSAKAYQLSMRYAKYGPLLDITYETHSQFSVSEVGRASGEWLAQELGIEYMEY